MTTTEIKTLFDQVYNKKLDVLNLFVELSRSTEEYEQSDFFKATKMSIFDAYSSYYKTAYANQEIIDRLQSILDGLDFSKIENASNESIKNMFDEIPEEYRDIFKSILESSDLI